MLKLICQSERGRGGKSILMGTAPGERKPERLGLLGRPGFSGLQKERSVCLFCCCCGGGFCCCCRLLLVAVVVAGVVVVLVVCVVVGLLWLLLVLLLLLWWWL